MISAENLIEQPPPMWLQNGWPLPDPDLAKLQIPSEPLCRDGEIAYPEPLHGPKGPAPAPPWVTLSLLGKPPQGRNGPYYYSGYEWTPGGSFATLGGGVRIAIAQPAVNQTRLQVHSLAQLAFDNGVYDSRGFPQRTIEFGWNVDPRLYGDDGRVRLFTYVNRNYYNDNGTTDCYNCNFTPTQTTYTPSQVLTPTANATTVGFAVEYYNGNWWYWFNDRWIGYTPGSYYNNSFTSSPHHAYFGEVYDPAGGEGNAPDSDMGNGFHGTDSRATHMDWPLRCVPPANQVAGWPPCHNQGEYIGTGSTRWENRYEWYRNGDVSSTRWRFGGPGG